MSDTDLVTTTRRYRYRVYPDAEQQAALVRAFGSARVVYNDFLQAREGAYRAGMPFESAGSLQKRLITNAKTTPERQWLAETSSAVLQQSLQDADRAYRNFFESLSKKRRGARVGPPRYKSKRDKRQSIRYTKSAPFRVAAINDRWLALSLARVPGRIRVRQSRPLPSAPSSVTIIREADDRFYASFTVQVEAPAPMQPVDRYAALDLGLTDFAAVVRSDGVREKVANPRHLRASERRLVHAQRALARKVRGGQNRKKAQHRVAVQHRKVRERRADHAHKLALRLIRENQAVTVEALNVRGLARSGRKGRRGSGLRKSVHDASWGQFLRLLTEKAQTHGRTVLVVDPAFSSQTCSACGVLDGPKPLSVRQWDCRSCGAILDRDYNAAVNLLVAAGQAETGNACGEYVRRALASAVLVEAGTAQRMSIRP